MTAEQPNPLVLSFESPPDLYSLLPRGGRPGFDYALVSVRRINDLKQEGWDIVAGLPPITVAGQDAFLLGHGEAILGARPGSTVPNYFVDEDLLLDEPTDEDSD